MLKAYAVALVLSTTTPVATEAKEGVKPVDNQQGTTQYKGHYKMCTRMKICPRS